MSESINAAETISPKRIKVFDVQVCVCGDIMRSFIKSI